MLREQILYILKYNLGSKFWMPGKRRDAKLQYAGTIGNKIALPIAISFSAQQYYREFNKIQGSSAKKKTQRSITSTSMHHLRYCTHCVF